MLDENSLRKFRDFAGKLCIAGRFDESVKSSHAAIDMIDADKEFPQKNKDAWRAAFFTLIANAYLAQKDANQAVAFFKRTLEIQMSLPKDINTAFTLDNLAKAQEFNGDILDSLESRVAALEVLQEFSPQSGILISEKYKKIIEDYESLGRTEEADRLRLRLQ